MPLAWVRGSRNVPAQFFLFRASSSQLQRVSSNNRLDFVRRFLSRRHIRLHVDRSGSDGLLAHQRLGDAYANAMAETFFATLECELINRRLWKTKTEARLAVFTWIESWYNPHRRHSGIGLRSPNNFERNLEAEPSITAIIESNDLIQDGQNVL